MKIPALRLLVRCFLSLAAGLVVHAAEPKAPEDMTMAERNQEIAVLLTAQEKNLARIKALGWNRSGTVMFFHGGLRLLSPYQVSLKKDKDGNVEVDADGKKHGFLEKGDTTPSGFIEFVYSNRWAWNEQRILQTKNEDGTDDALAKERDWVIGLNDLFDAHFWDVDARLVYNFAKGGDSDASAIVGSGDFGLEVTASRQLNRSIVPASPRLGDGAASFGFDMCYGLTTDKNSFDAHHRILTGLSYSVSKPNESGRWTLLTTRLGVAWVESVNLLGTSSREVKLLYDDVPDYDLRQGMGFEAELFYPIGTDAALTLGTRIYGKLGNPNPWTVYVGYTKPISDIFKGILPNSDAAPDKPTSKVPTP